MTMVFDEDLELDEEDFESMQKAGFNEEEAIAFKGVGYVIDIPFAWGFEVLLIEFKEDLELDEEDFESMEEFNEEEAIAFKGVRVFIKNPPGPPYLTLPFPFPFTLPFPPFFPEPHRCTATQQVYSYTAGVQLHSKCTSRHRCTQCRTTPPSPVRHTGVQLLRSEHG